MRHSEEHSHARRLATATCLVPADQYILTSTSISDRATSPWPGNNLSGGLRRPCPVPTDWRVSLRGGDLQLGPRLCPERSRVARDRKDGGEGAEGIVGRCRPPFSQAVVLLGRDSAPCRRSVGSARRVGSACITGEMYQRESPWCSREGEKGRLTCMRLFTAA